MNLFPMVFLGLLGAHFELGVVAVATGAHAAADDPLHGILSVFTPKVSQQADGLAIDSGQRISGIADFCAPVGAGAPGGAFQNEIEVETAGDVGVGAIIGSQCFPPIGSIQQDKGGKFRSYNFV